MRVFSTFTGIGGFEVGIQNAYRNAHRTIKTDSEANQRQGLLATKRQEASSSQRLSGECDNNIFNERPLFVGYSEIDRYACSVYERHFPGVKNYGDITTINAGELPDFDLLVGGFPCQAFSIAGQRKGFQDTRGTLFFDLARILQAKQPRYFIFENVKGLLSHDNGQTFKTIIEATSELGYDCQWQVLNSKDFGVPQNRERVFIVGHLRGQARPEVFPIRSTNSETIRELTSGVRETKRIYSGDGLSPTLNTMQGGQRQPKIVSKTIRVGGLKSPHGSKQNWDSYLVDGRIRRLTPLECERLQGFPDNWTQYGRDGETISDTQRYKMCGNAVTTNVVAAIFARLAITKGTE